MRSNSSATIAQHLCYQYITLLPIINAPLTFLALTIFMKKISLLLFISCLLLALPSYAQGKKTPSQLQQDMNLAQQYLQNNDFEKASLLYKDLYEDNEKNTFYYRQYLRALIGLKNYTDAEKLVRKQQKINKSDPSLNIDLGLIYKENNKPEEAKEQFDSAIKNAKQEELLGLAGNFSNNNLNDYAIAAYQKGRDLSKNDKLYAYEMALAYQRNGDTPNLIKNYLDYASTTPSQVQMVFNNLQRVANNEKDLEELQTQLYSRIQTEQDQIIYIEILSWALKQQKDFEGALVQMKALDRRLNENGQRVMDLAKQAFDEKQYDVAIDAYEYVIAKGAENRLHVPAKVELLHVRNEKITTTNNYTPQDLDALKTDYLNMFEALGKTAGTANAMLELSHLYAYYLNDLDKALELAEQVANMGNADARTKAYAKLDMGDFYLMQDDVWEATLYYSQVDKAFKDDILGEEARFRNAKLSYFNGDFDWAQSQLDVLKASTSELISNDAIELSSFIIDNLGLDTTTTTMMMFAHAELLITQNRTKEALATFDSINTLYPKHSLSDDVVMMRAKIALKKRDYKTTVDYLQDILDNYKDDLLVDNALFMLGDLYEHQLNDKPKAMGYYQEILLNQAGSLFMAEARKRFRKLRGDKVN